MGTVLPAHEITPAFETVFTLLKMAGWISGYRFEDARGYFLDWTTTGHQHAGLLQEVVKRHRLDEESRAKHFTAFCSGESEAADDWQSAQVERDFWLACLRELRISPDDNKLDAVCQVIAEWQPQILPGNR